MDDGSAGEVSAAPVRPPPCRCAPVRSPVLCFLVSRTGSELWWVGVLLSILGSMLATMGLNLQRYSHRVEAAKPLDERLPYYRQKPWIGAPPATAAQRPQQPGLPSRCCQRDSR